MSLGERLCRAAGCALIVTSIAASGVEPAAAVDLTSPAGWWQPIDQKTGKPLGLIRIYEQNGLFFGQVEPASPDDDRSRRCTRCTDERRDQPIIGLVLIRNMRLQGDEYQGGDILDPDTGRVYRCKFRLTDGGRQLIMRGFFGVSLFGRSQIWRRAEAPH
ncbi:MAG TPA: DUF2147 domain-containing protein [Steroidobacteraceae bacterium]|jgi:uncharacterized protein (DUF2147 family)